MLPFLDQHWRATVRKRYSSMGTIGRAAVNEQDSTSDYRSRAAFQHSARALSVRAICFAVVFTALQLGWQSLHDTPMENFIIHTCTVLPAAHLIQFLTPQVHVQAIRFTLLAPGGGLNVLNGCDGLEALFLLFSAFAVAPLPWKPRAVGALLGIPLVYSLNQVRILVLFYAYRHNHGLFDSLHGTVAPILVILCVVGYFYAWIAHAGRHQPQAV